MSVKTEHREFSARIEDWVRIRDALEGERAVKGKEDTYLPTPPGMRGGPKSFIEGGRRFVNDAYEFYIELAEFPEIIGPALDGLQGLIHEEGMDFELPPQLEYLIDDATADGDKLQELWEKVTREVFATGRLNLTHDIGGNDAMRFCPYSAESMINWRLSPKREGSEPQFVVFREIVDEPYDVEFKTKPAIYYRELRLVEGVYWVRRWQETEKGDPVPVVTEDTDDQGWWAPRLFSRNLLSIPIDVINAKGEGFSYGPIPIMPMVRRAFSIYRMSADYHRSLCMKTDPQPVVYGVNEEDLPDRIGGDSIWAFSSPDARAELLDIDGLGIPLLRQAIED